VGDVRAISRKRILEETERLGDADLTNDLNAWLQTVKAAQWKTFVELRGTFTSADNVDGMTVFNIRNNRFRLITRVIYSRWSEPDQEWTPGQILVGAVMTHAEYDRWNKLSAEEKKERIWPQR
jgi:mRNA interferase HigB